MLPILLSLGPIKIYSYGVCLVIGLFLALYFWWKMGRDEHFDEIALFDGYFLSLIIFLLAGRAGYVLVHASDFGTVFRSLALLAYPGVSGVVGIVAASIFIILFARSRGWDQWKVADSVVVALSLILIFGGAGSILNESKDLWLIGAWRMSWALFTFAIVSRVRKNFRFYAWYKGESSIAQEGLASLIFVMLVGVYYLGMREYLVGGLSVFTSGYLIYKRVGRRNEGIWSKLKGVIRRK